MNLEDFVPEEIDLDRLELSAADTWILCRLSEAAREANRSLEEYKFNEAASVLYAFTWNSFCDWYIELVKDDLYGTDPTARKRAQSVLYVVLESLLRLLHPLIVITSYSIHYTKLYDATHSMIHGVPIGGMRQVRNGRMFSNTAACRITSYNVCYTKLLRGRHPE